MSLIVACKGDYLIFSPNIPTFESTVLTIPLEHWVSKQGLVMPLNQGAFAFVNFLNGKERGVKGLHHTPLGVLLTLDGDVFLMQAKMEGGALVEEGDRHARPFPTGKGIIWSHCVHDAMNERTDSALRLTETPHDALKLMIKSDVWMAKNLEVFHIPALLDEINRIHKEKYPDHEFYKEAK